MKGKAKPDSTLGQKLYRDPRVYAAAVSGACNIIAAQINQQKYDKQKTDEIAADVAEIVGGILDRLFSFLDK